MSAYVYVVLWKITNAETEVYPFIGYPVPLLKDNDYILFTEKQM